MRWSSALFCLWVGCGTCYLQKFVIDILLTSLNAFRYVFSYDWGGWHGGRFDRRFDRATLELVLGRSSMDIFLIWLESL